MSKLARKSDALPATEVVLGTYTKRQAAARVADGTRHIHCTELGPKDPTYAETLRALGSNQVPHYLWEPSNPLKETAVIGSTKRVELVSKILKQNGIEIKRNLRERIELVLEELLTNALFHAFKAGQKEKYSRKKDVKLNASEAVKVRFAATEDGCFVEVSDNGGTLKFANISESLRRCYESESQIQNKESGAGLGIYMIFETATHIKIVNTPGKKTTLSCWIADSRSDDTVNFSFNYFEGDPK